MFSIQLSFAFEQLLNNFTALKHFQQPKTVLLPETKLQEIWNALVEQYFPTEQTLNCYQISWSDRQQKRCLASCNPHRKKVMVAKALANPKYAEILAPLLYHEMCHAALGIPKKVNGRFSYHGREFKALEKRHPEIPRLNLWIKNGGWTNAKRAHTRMSKVRQ